MRLSKEQINIMISIYVNTERGSRSKTFSRETLLGKNMNRLIQKGLVKFDQVGKLKGYHLTPAGLAMVPRKNK